MAEIRDLWGMTYKSVELEHDCRWDMNTVLEEFAHYIRKNEIHGYIVSMETHTAPHDEDLSITTLIYSDLNN